MAIITDKSKINCDYKERCMCKLAVCKKCTHNKGKGELEENEEKEAE